MSHVSVVPRARCEENTAATMAEKLTFEQRKTVLKWYWKYENIKKVQQSLSFRILPILLYILSSLGIAKY
jgi:hypothetical protein